jgi:hypothetical protein
MGKTATKTKREIPKRQPKPLGPTSPTQKKFAVNFQIKNARRKQAKAQFGPDYRFGRRNRSELAPRGCFGHTDPAVFNQCVVGTFGVARSGDDRED